MNITFVPENMQYLFQNADHLLSQEDITLLKEKDARAKKLETHNGALYPGLTKSAVFWLLQAYETQTHINKNAFQSVIEHLYQIHQPRPL